MKSLGTAPLDWHEALATVLSCTYEARAGRAIAFGLPSPKHFHITYNYYADEQLHTGELYAEKPIPQGSLFPVRYHPDDPGKSRHADTQPASPGVPLLAIGLAGSVFLSLAWLLFLHGCQR